MIDIPRLDAVTADLLDGSTVLTAAVDIGADRIEVEVVGWGRDGTPWPLARTDWVLPTPLPHRG